MVALGTQGRVHGLVDRDGALAVIGAHLDRDAQRLDRRACDQVVLVVDVFVGAARILGGGVQILEAARVAQNLLVQLGVDPTHRERASAAGATAERAAAFRLVREVQREPGLIFDRLFGGGNHLGLDERGVEAGHRVVLDAALAVRVVVARIRSRIDEQVRHRRQLLVVDQVVERRRNDVDVFDVTDAVLRDHERYFGARYVAGREVHGAIARETLTEAVDGIDLAVRRLHAEVDALPTRRAGRDRLRRIIHERLADHELAIAFGPRIRDHTRAAGPAGSTRAAGPARTRAPRNARPARGPASAGARARRTRTSHNAHPARGPASADARTRTRARAACGSAGRRTGSVSRDVTTANAREQSERGTQLGVHASQSPQPRTAAHRCLLNGPGHAATK